MTDDNEAPKFDISDCKQMQPFIEEKAKKLARSMHMREDIFSIHLTSKMRGGYMSMIPGPTVRIMLLWPDVFVAGTLELNLRSAFSTIRKRNDVYTPMAIATHAFFQREAGQATRWVKEKLGKDIAEKLEALIPKHRIVVMSTVTTQVIDTKTGTVVEKTVSTKGDVRDAPFDMWNELSQIIFLKHADTLDFAGDSVEVEPPVMVPALATENDNPYDDPNVPLPREAAELFNPPSTKEWPERVWVGSFLPVQMTLVQ